MFSRRSYRVLAAILALVVAPAVIAADPTPDVRLEVPSPERQSEAMKLVKELYGREIDAAIAADQKRSLVKKLLKKATETNDDPARRYVLLTVARDIAALAGDSELATSAVNALGDAFQIDVFAMQVDVVLKAAKAASPWFGAATFDGALVLIDQAVVKDRYDLAEQLAKAALELARAIEDSRLEERIRPRLKELEQVAAKPKDYQQAMATLVKYPADPEANLVVGKYLCLVKGDWARGLPLLALSGEEEYAWLAAKELKEVTEPAAQVEQGDGWWKLAERRDGTPQQQLHLHAAYWYRKAIPQLTGLLREKVQQRLAQVGETETHPAQASQTQAHPSAGLVAELHNPYASRSGAAKQLLLEASGGTAESERAVAAALAWIARHQNPDASWSLDYHARCAGPGCTGPGSTNAPGAATAFALLPFLAAGQTHETKGPYKARIYNGIMWTIAHQLPTGDLSVTGGQTQMYSHGIATIMLCEAYGMSHDKRLEGPAKAALRFIEVGQDQQTGGWWYTHRQPGGDTSVFGWQFMALKSGVMAGLAPSHVCFDLAKKWLESVSKEPKGQFAYMPDKGPSNTMTAVGLLCTQYLGVSSSDPRLVEGTRYLMNNPPDTKTRNNYYWYYATQVMHNQPGPQWDDWNRQMRTVLIKTQCGEPSCANGSWDPAKPGPDPWAAQGGRLMTTSLAALTLELYYRYAPLYAAGRHEANFDGDAKGPGR